MSQSIIGTLPNQVPTNGDLGTMAFQDSESVVIKPTTSAIPVNIGDMVFQLTNNTTLVIKVKGSDGTVRSNTITLS